MDNRTLGYRILEPLSLKPRTLGYRILDHRPLEHGILEPRRTGT